MSARRCAVAAVFGPEPWKVLWWWNDAPPARTTTGASSSSASSPAGFARRAGAPGGVRAPGGGEPVGGGVELAAVLLAHRPEVRPGDERDRARLGGGVVEGDPARDHLGRVEVVQIGAVLVHPERLHARRLPDAVVLEDADAVVAHELGREAAGALGQHLGGEAVVGLPAVADLARAVVGIATGDPVHLVGPDAGLILLAIDRLEPLAHALDLLVGDEALVENEESVAVERLELVGGELGQRHVGASYGVRPSLGERNRFVAPSAHVQRLGGQTLGASPRHSVTELVRATARGRPGRRARARPRSGRSRPRAAR